MMVAVIKGGTGGPGIEYYFSIAGLSRIENISNVKTRDNWRELTSHFMHGKIYISYNVSLR